MINKGAGGSDCGKTNGPGCGSGRKNALRRMMLALVLSAAVLLGTGCVKRSAGGSLTRQGAAALEKEDYQTALVDYQQALSNGEDPVMALRGEGIALMGFARYEEAAACFQDAISHTDTKMPETIRDLRLYLASAQYRAGMYPETITTCEELLDAGDELPETFYYLGGSYLRLSDTLQARENFDKAAALAGDDYSLYLQIYEAYESVSLTAVGDEFLQTALQIQPKDTEASYRIGQIYYYLEKYEEARSALLGPVEEKYMPALELIGEIYLAQEDYDHALATFRSIMEEKGESPAVFNGLALCSIASGNYDEALAYIEQGLSMEEEEGQQQLRFNEIVAYEKKLDFATALVKAEAYTALYPADEAGRRELTFLRTR